MRPLLSQNSLSSEVSSSCFMLTLSPGDPSLWVKIKSFLTSRTLYHSLDGPVIDVAGVLSTSTLTAPRTINLLTI